MVTVATTLSENTEKLRKPASDAGTTPGELAAKLVENGLYYIENREELERKHREGYERFPVQPGEFMDSDEDRAWLPEKY